MEEVNQGTPVKRKADRPTMFVTILNATHQEIDEVGKVMERAGVADDYRILISPKIIQAMSEYEIHEALSEFRNERDTERVNKMRHALFQLGRIVDGLNDAMGNANQNIEYVSNAINRSNTGEYVNVYSNGGLEKAKHAMEEMRQYLPKEGEEW